MQINENIGKIKLLLLLLLNTLIFSILLFTFFKQVQYLLLGFLLAFLFLTMLLNIITRHKVVLTIMYSCLIIVFINFSLILTFIENNDTLKIFLIRTSLISGSIGILILLIECFFVIKKIISTSD